MSIDDLRREQTARATAARMRKYNDRKIAEAIALLLKHGYLISKPDQDA